MKFISVKEALEKGKGKVKLRGWIYRERGSSQFKFVVIRDSTNIIQCVIKKEKVGEEKFDVADKLQIEASIEVEGTIKPDKRAPTGYEVQVDDFKVIGGSHEYPITKDQSFEFLLDQRHLWIRSRKMTSVLKIRSTITEAFHDYFKKKGFYEFQSPILTPIAGEEGSSLFEVDYFGEKIYLTQTWQLYAEAAIFALEKIYTIAPTFRAEKSKTSRHLTEFWMAEMEEAWCDFEQLQDHAEELIKHIVKAVLKNNKDDLKILGRDVKKLEPTVKKKLPRITYDEALKLLKEKKKMVVNWGKDLRTIEEDKLSELYDVPIIITRYPREVKAFYMKIDPENPKVVLGFDMIAPEGYGEIFGASQREEDNEEIIKRLKAKGDNPDKYGFYLDLRKYGSVPHAGFGMGVERVIAWICGLDNIKDAIPFPRTMNRYRP